MKKPVPPSLLTSFILFFFINSNAQTVINDSIKLQYSKIYSFCLDGDISSALKLIPVEKGKVSQASQKFITDFENRFASSTDRSNFLQEHSSVIDPLLHIFHTYWRSSLIDTSKHLDEAFLSNLNSFLSKEILQKSGPVITQDSLDYYFIQYIQRKGLYSTNGVGKTGKLYDLLVWKTQKDTTYSFNLHGEEINAKVILMDDFVTLGWEEYATLGKLYPGGWATDKALYCVAKAYDLTSEGFLISYLAHEGRHFSDYKLFPRLSSADLEYRAKLTELSMAKQTLYNLIQFFINNANYDSNNGHSIANYCVIRDLSKALFKVEYETDINKWKAIKIKKINKTAYKILQANTKAIQRKGTDTEKYIKA